MRNLGVFYISYSSADFLRRLECKFIYFCWWVGSQRWWWWVKVFRKIESEFYLCIWCDNKMNPPLDSAYLNTIMSKHLENFNKMFFFPFQPPEGLRSRGRNDRALRVWSQQSSTVTWTFSLSGAGEKIVSIDYSIICPWYNIAFYVKRCKNWHV